MEKTEGIIRLIDEGKKILEFLTFDDYDRWIRSVQFFVERYGSPMMIKETEKLILEKMNKFPGLERGHIIDIIATEKGIIF
ncbi:hypothetical protein J4447_04515 [Candidatus Pacearchaeota archaeon]|nr:hypothetical protein [Candidatus Pacearchaeota archaeon]